MFCLALVGDFVLVCVLVLCGWVLSLVVGLVGTDLFGWYFCFVLFVVNCLGVGWFMVYLLFVICFVL